MPRSGRARVASLACFAGLCGALLAAQGVDKAYGDLLALETTLRRELDLAPQRRALPPGEASAALLGRVRSAVNAYDDLARRNPRSAYSDNALWQAATLAADAYWQFGDTRDRATALRLFARLKGEFPSSSLIQRVASHTARLEGAVANPGTRAAVMLTAIRREVLPDALRFTLELEREATFFDERLSTPTRVFVDLQDTEAVEGLKDATLTFPDDVVRQARVGRQADSRTRVVFDLSGTARHSVYSLYNPYRVVIDFERPAALVKSANAATPLASGARPVPATRRPPAAAPSTARSSPSTPPAPARRETETREADAAPSTAAANRAGGFSLSRQLGLGVSRVVIDPGHGGRDPGAQIRGISEAQIVLDIALELERLLGMEPNVEVVLTRRANAYVPLEERTAIANRSGADLFLSIHVNASASASARGFETYFLNFAPNPEAEALAARENAGSAKTMSNLPEIVKAIALNNKIDESRDFASMVQRSMFEHLKQPDRSVRNLGVKQAPFMVLIGATMPSVLVEVSFLTNRTEAARLRSESYRREVAEALRKGIMSYQRSLKRSAVLRSAR